MKPDALRDWREAVAAVAGGAIVAVGAVLPWMSLFAGLHPYSGITGLYGRLTFAGGVLSVIGGVVLLARPDPRLRLVIGGLGLALALFAAWVLLGLHQITRQVSQHPFLLPRTEPGLFFVIAGALVVAALLFGSRRRDEDAR